MFPQKLDKIHWQGFCRRMSEVLAGQRTDIEITSPEAGIQLDARWLPATGLTYDPGHDVLDIAIEDIGHLTLRPHELYIEISARGLESFCVLDQNNVWQVVLLRTPLMLSPSPSPSPWTDGRVATDESTPSPTRAGGEP